MDKEIILKIDERVAQSSQCPLCKRKDTDEIGPIGIIAIVIGMIIVWGGLLLAAGYGVATYMNVTERFKTSH